MTTPAWIEEARRMLSEGMAATAAADALGVSVSPLRYQLDICGEKAKNASRKRRGLDKLLTQRRTGGTGLVVRKNERQNPGAVEEATPPPAKISLPFVAILAGHVSPSYQMVAR